MSGGGDPKKKNDWEQVHHTATKTEVQTATDMAAADALKRAQQADPAFVVVQGDVPGQVYRLRPGRNVMGRHPSCDIKIQQRAVSAYHAEVRVTEHGVILEDLKSTNGTEVAGHRINRPVALVAGQLVKIGSVVFKYLDNSLDVGLTEELHSKGILDELTGAYNKAHISKVLSSSIEIAKGGYPLSVVMIDLDFFKKINDTYGHIAGDYVLREACRVLRENVIRGEDLLGRFGGEEFMLVMPDAALETACNVAERIRATLEKHHFEFDGKHIPVTASLGVCAWKPAYARAEQMLEVADQLLYKSKQGGRNRVSSDA